MFKNIIACMMFLVFGSSIYSQKSFYVKPTIETKAYSSFESALGTNSKYKWPQNDYFKLENHNLFMVGSISLGLDVGMNYRNKHYFEIGIADDGAGMKTTLHTYRTFTDPQQGNFAFPENNTSHFAFQMLRFNFNYQYEVLNTQFIKGRFQTGVNLLFNPYAKNGQPDIFKSPGVGLEPINKENILVVNKPESIYSYRTRISPTVSLGIGFDFHSAKHYLFSLGVNYQQGFVRNMIASHTIAISDNGNIVKYRMYSESRSSGFIFQISRRFQIYPWTRKKKNMLE